MEGFGTSIGFIYLNAVSSSILSEVTLSTIVLRWYSSIKVFIGWGGQKSRLKGALDVVVFRIWLYEIVAACLTCNHFLGVFNDLKVDSIIHFIVCTARYTCLVSIDKNLYLLYVSLSTPQA